MEIEVVSTEENQTQGKEQRVKDFIEGMERIKFDGPLRRKFRLDTFLLLTYDQRTKEDEIEFVSWAVDSSRSDAGYIKTLLNLLPLPKGKNHPPYPRKENIPDEGKKIAVIAFGTGPLARKSGKAYGDGTFLFRRKEMSTKLSFERLKKAAGL